MITYPCQAVVKTDIKSDLPEDAHKVFAKKGDTISIISDEGDYFLGETEDHTFPVDSHEIEFKGE